MSGMKIDGDVGTCVLNQQLDQGVRASKQIYAKSHIFLRV